MPEESHFEAALAESRARVDEQLSTLVAGQSEAPDEFRAALEYVLLGGGKRLRPILCLWTHQALDGQRDRACLQVAAALECLHTYSLVHDDLPCMDDDDMRRGRPSAHRQFGEASAVLLGDALLSMCFEVLAALPHNSELEAAAAVQVMQIVARAAGTRGLITGQVLDLSSAGLTPTLATVENIHRYKTASLIGASMACGAALANVGSGEIHEVYAAGERAGRAFQIVDDLLDLEATAEQIGKTPGKDVLEGKLTFPGVTGREAAREEARRLCTEAQEQIAQLTRENTTSPLLQMLLGHLVSRIR